MWTRKELKAKGKASMQRNYWKTVLVSILVLFLLGGASASGSVATAGANSVNAQKTVENENSSIFSEEMPDLTLPGEDPFGADSEIPPLPEEFQQYAEEGSHFPPVLIAVLVILLLVVAVVAVVFNAFLLNPLEAGSARFFLWNLNTQAEVKELAYGYDHGYKNVVKTIFLKDIYTLLWSLLFIIPGIIKSYEYRMIPYLLAEYPDMPTREVFAKSRAMMKGNKWKAFVLDLSFLGWSLLSALTLGILGIFYVNPYRNMTNAALYERLAYGTPETTVPAASFADSTPAAYNAGELPYNNQ